MGKFQDHMLGRVTPPSSGQCWTGASFEDNEHQYVEHLSEADVQSIENAVSHFKGLKIARGLANPITFPLRDDLSKRLKQASSILDTGRGFQIFRGLEPAKYTEEDRVIMFAGLTSYVAELRESSISHIRNRSFANPTNDKLRPLERSCAMGFHSDVDNGNIVAMFTQSLPEEGGEQYLSSVEAICNILAKRDPEVLHAMTQDWYWEKNWRPQFDMTAMKQLHRPILAYEDGRFQMNFAAAFVGGNPEFALSPLAPPLSAKRKHAIHVISEAANEAKLKLSQQPGDILFFNNYGILHGRGEFTDSMEDPWKQRYLMRLILHDKNGWASAKSLQRDFSDRWDVEPKYHNYMTGTEWAKLPRSRRVKQVGVANRDDHD